ncbi:MAG: exodeoxyribonuclease V subunit gamma, partial [Gemmataceae bacterium]
MSTLYLGTHEETLAQKLAKLLDEAAQSGDWFAPSTVVAPNPYVAKWLRLWLARETGVVMNVRIAFRLEDLMWQLLKEVDGRSPSQPLALVTEDQYRLMVLAGLLAKENKEGDP